MGFEMASRDVERMLSADLSRKNQVHSAIKAVVEMRSKRTQAPSWVLEMRMEPLTG
jgi:hypothetical protein